MYQINIYKCLYMQDLPNLHLLQHWLGYEDAINETARETNEKIEIDEELKIILDSKLQILTEKMKQKPEIKFTYFIKDQRKEGGKYITKSGIVKKIDMYEGCIYLMDNTNIPIEDIIDISGEIFN